MVLYPCGGKAKKTPPIVGSLSGGNHGPRCSERLSCACLFVPVFCSFLFWLCVCLFVCVLYLFVCCFAVSLSFVLLFVRLVCLASLCFVLCVLCLIEFVCVFVLRVLVCLLPGPLATKYFA